MATLNPYLNFNGNTEAAFQFYKLVFGGEFILLQRMGDATGMPAVDTLSPSDQNKIMHVALPIGRGNILMGTDILESQGQHLTVGNNYYLCVNADSKEEAAHLFHGLSAGGEITMPLDDASWGDYFGMFTDKFGVQWMISYDYNQSQ